mmetsp:Transcript_39926/g.83029  ORF Transcript_39926/g.83029 Transcript_39926/m.83029 type:complete len:93 (+) Transcript_39926:1039-1317(+)
MVEKTKAEAIFLIPHTTNRRATKTSPMYGKNLAEMISTGGAGLDESELRSRILPKPSIKRHYKVNEFCDKYKNFTALSLGRRQLWSTKSYLA